MKRKVLFWLVLAGLAGVVSTCHRVPQAPEPTPTSFLHGVVVEEFADWACIPCKATARVLDSLQQIYPDLVVVRYASGALDPGDPLYTPVAAEVDARVAFYSLDLSLGVPVVRIQGRYQDRGYAEEYAVRWGRQVEEAGKDTPRVRLELLRATVSPDTSGGEVDVRLRGSLLSGDRVMVYVLEKGIALQAPNGETRFSHVFRGGNPVDGVLVDTVVNVPFTIPASVLHPESTEVVVFVQNRDSLNILDAILLSFQELSPVFTPTLRLTPDTARDTTVPVNTYTVFHFQLENLRADPHPVDVRVEPDSLHPVPPGWGLFICVNGRCLNTTQVVDTLQPGGVDSLFSVDVLPGTPDSGTLWLRIRSLMDSTRLDVPLHLTVTP